MVRGTDDRSVEVAESVAVTAGLVRECGMLVGCPSAHATTMHGPHTGVLR